MSDATLQHFIRQYIAANPGPELSFVWHGGEPTLAGLDFYRRAIDWQARYLPTGWTAWNSLQTNGVLLDDEWCEFLADNRFDVGLSLDGPAWLHDKQRPDPRGAGSFDAAAAAITRLQAHGIQPDLLCTVTPATAAGGVEVYRRLRDFGTGWIQFIPVVPYLTGEQYGEFLCAVFDEWAAHDVGHLDVQLFAETARTLAGGAPSLCWLAPTCGRALVVEANGSVYSCDHFVNPDHLLGNVNTSELGELVDCAAQEAFGALKQQLPDRCQTCPWLRLCNGGCPKDHQVLCTGLERFFAHAVPVLWAMMQTYRNASR